VAGRKLIVEVIADASKYYETLRRSSKAATVFSGDLKELQLQAEKTAQVQVAAAVKQTEVLRAEAAAFRSVAASAAAGSKEQIAAANLATEAERRLAASMGLASAEATKLRASTHGASREIDHAARGALSGSGLFHSFGRTLAFASGGFLAFEGLSRFIEESVSVAREAAVGQAQLAAQMKASGESFAASSEEVEKARLSMARFGFTSEDVDKALILLDRGTGSISKSIDLLGLTADLARAKNLDFAAAANVVAKVFGGQTTALRRAVPGLNANAKGWDLIREAQEKLAGQAAAGTTASQRFAATLHETQRILGEALLPTLNTYLEKLSVWLDRMNESGRLQRNVETTAHLLSTAFDATASSIAAASDAYREWRDLTGAQGAEQRGDRDTSLVGNLRRLFGSNIFSQGQHLAALMQKLQDDFAKTTTNADDARVAVGAFIHTIGEGSFGRTRSPLLPAQTVNPLGAGDPFADAREREIKPLTAQQRRQFFDSRISRALDRVQDLPLKEQVAALTSIADQIGRRYAKTKDVTRRLALEDQLVGVFREIQSKRQELSDAFLDALQLGVDRAALTKTLDDDLATLEVLKAGIEKQIRVQGATLDLQERLIGVEGEIASKTADLAAQREDARAKIIAALQLRVDRATLTRTLRDDLARQQDVVAGLKAQIRQYGSTLDLQEQLVSAQSAVASTQDQIAANRKKAEEAARAAISRRQFRELGLTATGEARVAGLNTLRAEFRQVSKAISDGLIDADKATRKQLRSIGRVLRESGVREDVRKWIQDYLDPLKKGTQTAAGEWTKFRSVNTKGFIAAAGLGGLGARQRERLSVALSMLGPGATVPGAGSLAFSLAGGGGVVVNGDVHVHDVRDVGHFEQELTKRSKARQHVRRGNR
jgi:hypothetical protein